MGEERDHVAVTEDSFKLTIGCARSAESAEELIPGSIFPKQLPEGCFLIGRDRCGHLMDYPAKSSAHSSGNRPGEKGQAEDDDAGAASGLGLVVGYARRAGFGLLGTAEPVLGELGVVL